MITEKTSLLRSCVWIGFIISLTANITLGQEYNIDYLSVKDGLSQNEVTSIIKDDYGFMWFGTRGGLNRYDGYEFKHYKPSHNKKYSINNPSIECLSVNKQGNILIGTKSGGFSHYYPENGQITHNLSIDSININRVTSLCEDFDGNTWIGTWKHGVCTISANKDSVGYYLGRQSVLCIVQTPDSTIWLGTSEGLLFKAKGQPIRSKIITPEYQEITDIFVDEQDECLWIVGWGMSLIKLDYNDHSYEVIPIYDENGEAVSSYSVLKDGDKIWLGTWGKGLFVYDTKLKKTKQFNLTKRFDDNTKVSADIILDIYCDDVGGYWLGTNNLGVIHISRKNNFNNLSQLQKSSKLNMQVNSVLEDRDGNVLIATPNKGFFILKDKHLKKVPILRNGVLTNSYSRLFKHIYLGGNNTIWVSANCGLFILEQNTSGEWQLIAANEYFNSPDLEQVEKAHCILEDNNNVWFGTQQSGLFVFEREKGIYKLKQHFQESEQKGALKNNRVTSFVKDANNRIWLGTYNGLLMYNVEDSSFTDVRHLLDNPDRLMCDITLCTFIDKHNTLWFGTPCGLNKLQLSENGPYSFRDYSIKDGLLDDYVNAILADDKGRIWLTTNAGISCLNPKTDEIINFTEQDGVNSSNFYESSRYKNDDGLMYFGGYEGLTYFKPDEIKENDYQPFLRITNFSIFNKSVPVTESGILTTNINSRQHIELGHTEKEFSFEFSSLDYKTPERNLYAYKLVGHSNDWIYIGNRRHVSFSNLKPGDYTLLIKGTNSNGHWSDKKFELDIKVNPAPWRTWYAVVLYVLIIVVVVYFITQMGVRQERLLNSVKVERLKRLQEKDLNDYKLRLFTNISHELRTPLTLILAPIKELLSKDLGDISDDTLKLKHQLIYQNSNRLYRLITQLLDFRRAEAGKLKLETEEVDIKLFIKKSIPGFQQLADNKQTSFETKFEGNDWLCYVDTDKLTTIINNLLSNAFKYSGHPGKVMLRVKAQEESVEIQVSNDGKGIQKKDMEHLFQRFYQAGDNHNSGSSGIGLSLVKSFVELHRGQISVESIPNKITTFIVRLQKGKAHLTNDQIRTSPILKKAVAEEMVDDVVLSTRSVNKGTKGTKVLVVEDNDEVRSYIVGLLSELHEVIEASDGQKGYDLIIEHKPDVVISDVMMPVMDGFELCQKVKTNSLVAHIPIVLLTAKGTMQDQLFGAKKGADVYLTKPFAPEILIEKVKGLLVSRKVLSKKYTKKVMLVPTNAEITLGEEKFIQACIKVIEANMANQKFDANQLAKEMAMSSSTFYRKAKKATEKPPNELIRSIRFKRAAQLVKDSDLSISEIAEMIGYTDIKSFRKVFKRYYEMTPSEYRNNI